MNFKKWIWAIPFVLSVLILGCNKDGDEFLLEPKTTQKTLVNESLKFSESYSNGVFMVNEGWFGHEPGSVHFWDRNSSQIQTKVYQKENSGKKLGITTQYACIQNGHFYLVSKGYKNQKGNVTIANANTLQYEGTITCPSKQCRAFVALNKNTGYLSTGGIGTKTGNGIYQVNLQNYQIQDSLAGIGTEEVGNLLIANNKLFALKTNSLLIINSSNNQIAKTITFTGKAGGMIKDKNNNIWVAADNQLIKINSFTNNFQKINLLGASVNPSYGWAWNAGSLTYSASNHTLYFVNGGGWKPNKVACYHIDTNQTQNLFTVDSGWQIYGAGTYIDPVVDKLYVTALKGFGQDAKYNRMYVYDLNGNKEKTLNYNHFYFTALCIAQ